MEFIYLTWISNRLDFEHFQGRDCVRFICMSPSPQTGTLYMFWTAGRKKGKEGERWRKEGKKEGYKWKKRKRRTFHTPETSGKPSAFSDPFPKTSGSG